MMDFGVCEVNRTVQALKLPKNEHLTPSASGLFDSFLPPPDREFQEPAFQGGNHLPAPDEVLACIILLIFVPVRQAGFRGLSRGISI